MMDYSLKNSLKKIFASKRITLPEMMTLLYTTEFDEFIDCIKDFINDNYDKLIDSDDFFDKFHIFLYTLTEQVMDNREYLYQVKYLISSIIKLLKEDNKKYNKKEVKKDSKYFISNKILSNLNSNLTFIDILIEDSYEKIDFQMIMFIINELKNPDYLFRLLELNPSIANIKNIQNESLFSKLVDNYLRDLDDLTEEAKKYYKRIFVLLLESDELYLDDEELINTLIKLNNNLSSSKKDGRVDINFLVNEINNHYTMINQDSRVNALSYLKKESPIILRENAKYRERVDLTDLFTFSIDTVNEKALQTLLIDDAYSIIDNGDETYTLYVHVPDVDHFIKKDSETDLFMRSLGETVYKRDFRTHLINPSISGNFNLKQGVKRPAITFIFKLDKDAKLLDIDFMESIINVNYNLNNTKANMYMKNFNDERLKKALQDLSLLVNPIRKFIKNNCNKKGANLIVEEYNIFTDILVASYMKDQDLPFIYKCYSGLRDNTYKEHISVIDKFIKSHDLSEEEIAYMYSIFDINNRVYYDNVAHENKGFGGHILTNVGNPLREYISLEALRVIKDMVINKEKNYSYWEERVLRDVIEYTETSAKIRNLTK